MPKLRERMLYPGDRVAPPRPTRPDMAALRTRARQLIRDAVPDGGQPLTYHALIELVAADAECYVLDREQIVTQIERVRETRPVTSQIEWAGDEDDPDPPIGG